MRRIKLLARIAGAALAALLYVWLAAVRNAGSVRARKAARRRRAHG